MKFILQKTRMTSHSTKKAGRAIGVKPRGIEEVFARVLAACTGLTKEMLTSVWSAFVDAVCDIVAAGEALKTELFTVTPSIKGTATEDAVDIVSHFKPGASLHPGERLKKAAAKIPLEYDKSGGRQPHISSAFDCESRELDATITSCGHLVLKGDKIQVEGDNAEVGVYLINTESGQRIKVDAKKCVVNKPGKVMVYLPEIPDGQWTVKVVTQYPFAAGSHRKPYSVSYNVPLAAVREAEVSD